MDQTEIHHRAENLVNTAEHLDSNNRSSIQRELDTMSIQDQVAVARQMQQISNEHCAHDPHLPHVAIFETSDAGGTPHVQDIEVSRDRSRYSPARLVGSTRYNTDVYDPPSVGDGMASQAHDTLNHRTDAIDQQVERNQR